MNVCRICLSKEGRLYPITSNGLRSLYHQLIGVVKLEDDVDKRLPQCVCAECGLRLFSYNKLRHKSLRAHQILTNLLNRVAFITDEDINQIDREGNNLKSDLSYSPIHYEETDLHDWKHKLKEEFDVNIEIGEDIKTGIDSDVSDFAASGLEKDSDVESNLSDLDKTRKPSKPSASVKRIPKKQKVYPRIRNKKEEIEIKDEVKKFMSNLSKEIINKNVNKKEILKINPNLIDDDIMQGLTFEEKMVEFENNKYLDNFTNVEPSHIKKPELKIEQIDINVDLGYNFKTEVMSDECVSEAAPGSEKNSDIDSDLSDIEDNCKLSDLSASAKKLQKTNLLKTKKEKEHKYMKNELRRFMGKVKDEIADKKLRKRTKNKGRGQGQITETNQIEDVIAIHKLTLEEEKVVFENKRHSDKYVNSLFKCNDCFKGFRTETTFTKHRLMHSDKWGKIECTICKIRCRNKTSLLRHMHTHYHMYRCKECPFTTRVWNSAKLHRLRHKGRVYKCPQCHLQFEHKSSYMSHLRIKHVSSQFACDICGYSFVSARGVQNHKNLTHSLEQNNEVSMDGPMCVMCNIRFASDEVLETHYRVSHPQNPDVKQRNEGQLQRARTKYICELCGQKTANAEAYNLHFHRRHPNKEPTLLPELIRVVQRSRSQNQARLFICDQCGLGFKSKTALVVHEYVHTDQRPYECNECNKKFKSKLHIQNHINNMHLPTKIYACEICGREFNNMGNRNRHVKKHSDLRPYTCEYCGSSFKDKAVLTAHTNHVHLKLPWPTRKRGPRQWNEKHY